MQIQENGIPQHQVKPDDDGFEYGTTAFSKGRPRGLLALTTGEDADALITLPAIVTLVNDRAICIVLNPLDGGEFPYDIMPWQRRPDFGRGRVPSRFSRAHG